MRARLNRVSALVRLSMLAAVLRACAGLGSVGGPLPALVCPALSTLPCGTQMCARAFFPCVPLWCPVSWTLLSPCVFDTCMIVCAGALRGGRLPFRSHLPVPQAPAKSTPRHSDVPLTSPAQRLRCLQRQPRWCLDSARETSLRSLTPPTPRVAATPFLPRLGSTFESVAEPGQ